MTTGKKPLQSLLYIKLANYVITIYIMCSLTTVSLKGRMLAILKKSHEQLINTATI